MENQYTEINTSKIFIAVLCFSSKCHITGYIYLDIYIRTHTSFYKALIKLNEQRLRLQCIAQQSVEGLYNRQN